jgi:F-type H+-transporting ATPase subunit b
MAELGFHWPSLLVYLVNFSILLALLYIVGYKPILRMLNDRTERISNSLKEAEQVRSDSEASKEAMREELDQARQEGQVLISQAKELGARYRDEERQKAQEEAKVFLKRARKDIERERDTAIEEVRQHFAGLALAAAERIIERSLDKQSHMEVIEETLQQSSRIMGDN